MPANSAVALLKVALMMKAAALRRRGLASDEVLKKLSKLHQPKGTK